MPSHCVHLSGRPFSRLSVTFVYFVEKNKPIFKKISPSGSHTILVFLDPSKNVECRWGRHKSRFSANIWLHRVLWTLRPSSAPDRGKLRPPSHQTKTMKTALRPENLDERSAVVVKKEKCAVFEFILRIYYVPGRQGRRSHRSWGVMTPHFLGKGGRGT